MSDLSLERLRAMSGIVAEQSFARQIKGMAQLVAQGLLSRGIRVENSKAQNNSVGMIVSGSDGKKYRVMIQPVR